MISSTNLVNLKYWELEGVKSTDYDNINTLTHEFELNFTDLYSYLIYDNTIEFKENIKVSINNIPLSTITEIVIPANLETILYNTSLLIFSDYKQYYCYNHY